MMHAELPIIGGHVLMATDMLRSIGQATRIGNNTTLCRWPGLFADRAHLSGPHPSLV
ncbi:MAG TPA: hypothetical protein VMV92_09755 [Streptosporangiaceae bacterium]|nr:hypothetical protein [Streptosporangiaceae bacterium]